MTLEDIQPNSNKDDYRHMKAQSDTPAPLSADSLHKQIESHIAIAQNFNPGPRGQQAIHEEAGHIMKLIADSLPEKRESDYEAYDDGFNDCLEAVRAVLIPPTGSSPTPVDASAQGHEAGNQSESAPKGGER